MMALDHTHQLIGLGLEHTACETSLTMHVIVVASESSLAFVIDPADSIRAAGHVCPRCALGFTIAHLRYIVVPPRGNVDELTTDAQTQGIAEFLRLAEEHNRTPCVLVPTPDGQRPT